MAENGPDAARRSARSRDAILKATRDLVGAAGYPKLTIEAIAARAGVGKQTIYRWWPSKGAVVLDAVLALSETAVDGAIELPDTGDIDADLREVLRATVAEFADPAFGAPLRAVYVEVITDDQLAAAYRRDLAAPVEAAKLRRLRSAQEAGQVDAGADLELLLEMLYAPVVQRWLLGTGPLDADFADRIVAAALRSVRPAGRTARAPARG